MEAPADNQVRLYVDAGYNVSNTNFSVVIVIRNSFGHVLGAKACLVRNSGLVLGTELTTIRFGTDFLLMYEFTSTCIYAVQALTQQGKNLGPNRILIFEFRPLTAPPSFLYMKKI